jgi:hypothetical protein
MTTADERRRKAYGLWVVNRANSHWVAESYSSDETLAGPFDTYDEANTRRNELEAQLAQEANDS